MNAPSAAKAKNLLAVILLAPAAALVLLFVVWPLGELVALSTLRTDFIRSTFVGAGNFVEAFRSRSFQAALANTAVYIALLVPLTVGGALVPALALANLGRRWQSTARIVMYVPTLSAGVIIAPSWRWLFGPNGPLNWALSSVGLPTVNWFGSGATTIPAVSVIVASAGLGGVAIMALAAVMAIDDSVIDSARIDGASQGQINLMIVVPMIRPTILLFVVLASLGAMQVFETIYALAPYDYAATLTYEVYLQGFQFSHYGLAAAEALITAALAVPLALIRDKDKTQ